MPGMRVLILHSEPDDFKNWLTQEFPQHQFCWAWDKVTVQSQLESQPEVVLSIKHSDFPAELHAAALQAQSVRWFHVGGSGTEHLGSWNSQRVTVTNSVGVLAPFHAERTMAGLLALSSGLLEQRQAQFQKQWLPSRFESLQDKTMLIVGVGRTGGELAKRARSFGMRVLGVRASGEAHPDVQEMFRPEQLPELCPRAQVLSLNLRVTPEVHHLISGQVLDSLPQGSFLLNGSRGAVLDTDALKARLDSGRLKGAWLDVFESEPLPPESELWSHPRVIVSAHCADQVDDFPLRFARLFAENLKLWESGKPLLNLVSSPT